MLASRSDPIGAGSLLSREKSSKRFREPRASFAALTRNPMRLYVDTADGHAITQAAATGFVFGVTTNPTLLRRATLRRTDLAPLVRTALHAGLHEIHLQVFSDDPPPVMAGSQALPALG